MRTKADMGQEAQADLLEEADQACELAAYREAVVQGFSGSLADFRVVSVATSIIPAPAPDLEDNLPF